MEKHPEMGSPFICNTYLNNYPHRLSMLISLLLLHGWVQLQKIKASTNANFIYYDNASDLAVTKNSVFLSRTKHIKLHHHFIRKLE